MKKLIKLIQKYRYKRLFMKIYFMRLERMKDAGYDNPLVLTKNDIEGMRKHFDSL